MLVQTIKYCTILFFGVAVGYYIVSYSTESKADIGNRDISSTSKIAPSIDKIVISRIKVGDSINQDTLDKLDKLDKLVNSQQEIIKELQNKLTKVETNSAQNDGLSNANVTGKLEAISMKDFEELMIDQYIDKFRGFTVELEEDRFDLLAKGFKSNGNKDEWIVSYEDNINTFIYNADTSGLHIIDQFSCNSHMCRLKVITDEGEQWEKIIYSMAQQGWFESVILKEKTDDPTNYNYLLSSPRFN